MSHWKLHSEVRYFRKTKIIASNNSNVGCMFVSVSVIKRVSEHFYSLSRTIQNVITTDERMQIIIRHWFVLLILGIFCKIREIRLNIKYKI